MLRQRLRGCWEAVGSGTRSFLQLKCQLTGAWCETIMPLNEAMRSDIMHSS
jgi:hypothetical protein